MLLGKAFDKIPSEALGFASWSIVATTWCFQASPLFDAPQASSKRCRR
jgi:hypothetical protein